MKFKVISQFQFFFVRSFVFNCQQDTELAIGEGKKSVRFIFLEFFYLKFMSLSSWHIFLLFFTIIFLFNIIHIFLKLLEQQQHEHQKNGKMKNKTKLKKIAIKKFIHRIVACLLWIALISLFIFWWNFIDKQVQKWTIFFRFFLFLGCSVGMYGAHKYKLKEREKNVKWRWTKHIKHEIAMFKSGSFYNFLF